MVFKKNDLYEWDLYEDDLEEKQKKFIVFYAWQNKNVAAFRIN